MTRRVTHNREGFAALISVMMAVVLFSFVLAGSLSVVIGNRKYNNDDHLSRQALLAAESGANEMLFLIQKRIRAGDNQAEIEVRIDADDVAPNDPDCEIPSAIYGRYGGNTESVPFAGSTSGAAITCLEARFGAPSVPTVIPAQGTRVIKVPNNTRVARVQWSDDGLGLNRTRPNDSNTSISNWNASAGILMQVVNTGADRDSITEHTTFIRPEGAGSAGTGSLTDQSVNADCDPGNFCTASIDFSVLPGPANRRATWVKLTALYETAHIKIEALNGSGGVIPFTNVVTIDSTGEAGGVKRRIQRQVSIGGVGQEEVIPPFTLYAEGSICKDWGYDEATSVVVGSRDGTGCTTSP